MNIAEHIPTISLIIGIAIAVRELRKGPSESEARVTGSAVDLLAEYRQWKAVVDADMKVMREEIKALRTENDWLKLGVSILVKQLQEHDIAPLWTPDSSQTPVERPKTDGQDDKGNRKRRGF